MWGKTVTQGFSAISRTAAESLLAAEMGTQGNRDGDRVTVSQNLKPTEFNNPYKHQSWELSISSFLSLTDWSLHVFTLWP